MSVDVVELLLASGADPTLSSLGLTPFKVAQNMVMAGVNAAKHAQEEAAKAKKTVAAAVENEEGNDDDDDEDEEGGGGEGGAAASAATTAAVALAAAETAAAEAREVARLALCAEDIIKLLRAHKQ
jgi:hypothetical protein